LAQTGLVTGLATGCEVGGVTQTGFATGCNVGGLAQTGLVGPLVGFLEQFLVGRVLLGFLVKGLLEGATISTEQGKLDLMNE
jgi:hypothetical protein